ncbi:MAG TPA: PfkB family carbohydrate kinase, partial [Acidobacteriota bacterium]|nr:PfkB family carbohydrate kinase [Acidobacteriota bacterium]
EVVNVLGAGDAFASGFIYGYLAGWDWYKACRLANACGAILVTKHGCANFNPTLEEVNAFIEEKGGF